MLHTSDLQNLRELISVNYYVDEAIAIQSLATQFNFSAESLERIYATGFELITKIRQQATTQDYINYFLEEYDLSTEEGVVLMCLAEALLRIPDNKTQIALIIEKLSQADWHAHLHNSDSFFVNASTWSLLLGKEIVKPHSNHFSLFNSFHNLAKKAGNPIIQCALKYAIKLLSEHFIIGNTLAAAMKNAAANNTTSVNYSFDMLGEAARTAEDAQRYYYSYQEAISEISKLATHSKVFANPGISVKLSALHPRFEFIKREILIKEITPLLLKLAQQAKAANISLTIDAEEARILDLSLEIIEKVFSNSSLNNWDGLGVAVQAYQKRAPFVIDWLIQLAQQLNRRLAIRLVKGAYWDAEIKYSQVNGLPGYPLFTRKTATDVSYLACAKKIIAASPIIYPQFATHNAYTVAAILEMAETADLKNQECRYLVKDFSCP